MIVYILLILIVYLLLNNKAEHFPDPYSIYLHADATNKMNRRNMYHSKRYSTLNNKFYKPIEDDLYHSCNTFKI